MRPRQRRAPGAVLRSGATTDIDEAKAREAHIRSLMMEVNHRSRNVLAVAIAIARRSVVGGDTAQDFERRFSQRLLGLVASQKVLTDHEWRGVPLEALVRAQSVDRMEGSAKRFTIGGPDLLLNPAAAQTLGLALQELRSNAIEFGALSGEGGHVDISWSVDGRSDDPYIEMEWREHGGPKIVSEHASGFGRIVMEQMTAQGLNGRAKLNFEADGVSWSLRAPLNGMVVGPV